MREGVRVEVAVELAIGVEVLVAVFVGVKVSEGIQVELAVAEIGIVAEAELVGERGIVAVNDAVGVALGPSVGGPQKGPCLMTGRGSMPSGPGYRFSSFWISLMIAGLIEWMIVKVQGL